MANDNEPLEFMKSLWGNMGFSIPGMVAPTLDTDDLDKRIGDLKTVEGWLKTNLGLLQMTIHGLEMQRTTLAAMQAISQSGSAPEADANPFANPSLWPWPFMPQANGEPTPPPEAKPAAEPAPAAKPRKKKEL